MSLLLLAGLRRRLFRFGGGDLDGGRRCGFDDLDGGRRCGFDDLDGGRRCGFDDRDDGADAGEVGSGRRLEVGGLSGQEMPLDPDADAAERANLHRQADRFTETTNAAG
jgi:hypothetical protein